MPVIDLAPARRADGTAGVVDAVAAACADWGFFQVVNHGVPPDLLGRVWRETRRFFDLPRRDKLALLRSRENPRGYYDRELTKNRRDLKEVFDFGAVVDPRLPDDHPANRDRINGCNKWPSALPGFRSVMLEYLGECERLGARLLALFSLGLGAGPDGFEHAFKPRHSGFIRLNHYPVADPLGGEASPDVPDLGDMALHHHSDAGALTILLQDDVGGLQCHARGEWRDVPCVEGAFVINTADMMQVWSNDHYRAPLHRVLPVTDRARFSIPFFLNPSYDCDCAPLESLLADDAPHYRPVNWGEFRQRRTDGDYADYGPEVQLDDYRLA